MNIDEWANRARTAGTASALRSLLANPPAGVPAELLASIRAALRLAEQNEDEAFLKILNRLTGQISGDDINTILDWWRHLLCRARENADLETEISDQNQHDAFRVVKTWLEEFQSSLSMSDVIASLVVSHPISGQSLEVSLSSADKHSLPGVLADFRQVHLDPLIKPNPTPAPSNSPHPTKGRTP